MAADRLVRRSVVREDRKLMVGKGIVLGAIGDPTTCTINVQQPQQFAGTGGYTYGRTGRIEKNVNWHMCRLNPKS
jgi:hypothetical protein